MGAMTLAKELQDMKAAAVKLYASQIHSSKN